MKMHLFFVLFLLASIDAISQNVVYDFLGQPSVVPPVPPNIELSKYRLKQKAFFVKNGDFSTLQIKNINTLIYEVDVKSENVEFNVTPPPVFELFFDTEKFAQPEAVPAAVAAVAPTFVTTVDGYKDFLENLEYTKKIYDNMVLLAESDHKTQAEIRQAIDRLDVNNLVLDNPRLNTDKVTILTKCTALYTAVQNQFNKVEAEYQKLPVAPAVTVDPKDTQRYKEIVILNGKVTGYNYSELFGRIATLYDLISSPTTFIVTTTPILAKGDIVKYDIEIKPKKEKISVAKREESFSIPVPVVGGLKLDFSTGVFFTTDKRAMPSSYRLEAKSATDKTIKENGIQNQFVPSVGAMVHVSRKSASWIKPALSFGLGLKSTNLENSSYFLGVSGIAGQEQRFILSIGITGSRVNYLKPEYSANQDVPLDTKVEDITEKSFRIGRLVSFVGLTYNLTPKKKAE